MSKWFKVASILVTVHWLLVTPALAGQQAGQEWVVLRSGVGARALGMGGAFTAVADNADSVYWNPAGLSQLQKGEATTMQTRLSTDADHYYISVAFPNNGWGNFGVSWVQMGLGDITRTASSVEAHNEVVKLGSFSYTTSAYLLAYGREFFNNLSLGVTGKYLTASMLDIAGGQASGYGLDLGALFKPNASLSLGLKVEDVVSELSWTTGTKEKPPMRVKGGVALRFDGLILASEVRQIIRRGYSPTLSAGFDWNFFDGVSLRAGYNEEGFTAGAGFRVDSVSVDYAYVTLSSLSRDNTHRISLSGRW